jgi:hypothetical protein
MGSYKVATDSFDLTGAESWGWWLKMLFLFEHKGLSVVIQEFPYTWRH